MLQSNSPILNQAIVSSLLNKSTIVKDSGAADKNMAKKDFFKLVVLAVVLNQPPFMVSALYETKSNIETIPP
jgi:hypothetical protein